MVDTLQDYEEPLTSQEERKLTGKYAAAVLVVIFSVLGLYHAFMKQSAILAGLIVPVFIMSLYLFWVLHLTKKTAATQGAAVNSVVIPKPETSSHS